MSEEIPGPLACQYSISVPAGALPAIEFKTGMKVDWSKIIPPKRRGPCSAKRGRIGSMSDKSGNRLQFELSNANADWCAMFTATFPERTVDGRLQMKGFIASMQIWFAGQMKYAWVREYQGRGAVHYHVLFDRQQWQARGWLDKAILRPIKRKGKWYSLIGGEAEMVVVNAWLQQLGTVSPACERFNWGGVVELLAEQASAAKYFGSYLGKEEQKTVPDDAEVNGRWWYISPNCKPVPNSYGHLLGWHEAMPMNKVFDKSELAAFYSTQQQPAFVPKWIRDALKKP